MSTPLATALGIVCGVCLGLLFAIAVDLNKIIDLLSRGLVH